MGTSTIDLSDGLTPKQDIDLSDGLVAKDAAPTAPAGTPGGALPDVPGAPTPAGMNAPGPDWGSSAGDVASVVGQHAKNLVAGPVKALTAAPQGTAEKIASAGGPGGLAGYRMLVEPSIAPAREAFRQALQGRYGDAARSAESAIPVVGPWADQIENDVQQHGAVAGLAGLGTDVLAPKAAGAAIGALPGAAEDASRGIINKTVIGARKGDFARGANPARGYLDNNIGPSTSMESIADNSADARDEVGQALGDAYAKQTANGKLIPADEVRKAVHPILDQAKKGATAPLVVADPAVYDQMRDSLEPALQAADAKGGFTPKELWDIRHDLNKSLNWKDQTKLNLTKTQQQISGKLGGVLEDAVPEVKDLNQKYQDLVKLHDRAAERAQTGSHSLTGMAAKAAVSGVGALLGGGTHTPLGAAGGAVLGAALDSVPVKTTVATGLHGASRALAPIASAAPAAALPATLAAVSGNAQPNNVDRSQNDEGNPETGNEVTHGAQYTPEVRYKDGKPYMLDPQTKWWIPQ